MHYTMNYAYDFQAAQLVHRNTKPAMRDFQQPKPKPVSHRRALDAEDLTRRLEVVIAERKAYNERRRKSQAAPSTAKPSQAKETREEKLRRRKSTALEISKDKRKSRVVDQPPVIDPASVDGPYVPRVAASQFTSTTLGDSPPDKPTIHRLSRAALKYHLGGLNADPQVASTAAPHTAPIEQAKALRRAQSLRDKQYDRNQFQAPEMPSMPDMPEGLEPDVASPIASKRRTLYAAASAEERELRASRRKSTGSFLGNSRRLTLHIPPLNSTDLATIADAHRVDWTQSDENPRRARTPRRPKSISPPGSSRENHPTESRWKLRSRLNSFHKSKEEKQPSPALEDDESSKSPIAALFARFRR